MRLCFLGSPALAPQAIRVSIQQSLRDRLNADIVKVGQGRIDMLRIETLPQQSLELLVACIHVLPCSENRLHANHNPVFVEIAQTLNDGRSYRLRLQRLTDQLHIGGLVEFQIDDRAAPEIDPQGKSPISSTMVEPADYPQREQDP